ncbi:MAG: nitroreductase [Abditibacteriota bacterium]|nr:nitroreductase [Abditibacteriota bacterium]MBP5719257.1 nitroreductase [Abditibacteriota bacterium]
MNAIEAMKTRRSVRKFKPVEVPEHIIDTIIDAGLYAASGRNKQSTLIINVVDKDIQKMIREENRKIGGWEEGFDPFYGAPNMLIVLTDKTHPTAVYDGSLVMGNLMLAAHELGIGSCWIHRAKEEFDSAFGKKLLAALEIDGEWEGVGHCALGYAEEVPPAPKREPNRVFTA